MKFYFLFTANLAMLTFTVGRMVHDAPSSLRLAGALFNVFAVAATFPIVRRRLRGDE